MSVPFLRPDGLIYGRAAREAVACGEAGRLAGGRAGFVCAELLGGADGAGPSRLLSFADLNASSDPDISLRLKRLTAPRPALAGLDWSRTHVMGIVNVTPDSFSDGGLYQEADIAIAQGGILADEGADILDIGGESTRPGAAEVDEAKEMARIGPVLDGLTSGNVPLSIDTRKASVMAMAAAHGAAMLNDVSALEFDPGSVEAARETGLPVVLMHAQGTPGAMQDDPHYDDVLVEVCSYLEKRISICEQAGLAREKLIVDPGIGFGKNLEHNLSLLAGMSALHGLGCPVLLGASRKRFIAELSGGQDAAQRLPGSLAAVFQAASQAVQIVRVHDVAPTRQALDVAQAMMAV